MANENDKASPEAGQPAQKSRRDFVKTSAQVAVTAPAVAMLLSSKPAHATLPAYIGSVSHILDDFTFGNNREDIDSISLGSNFNPLDGKPQQDDHV